MRSQKPERFFDSKGKLSPLFSESSPSGTRRMSANPHANGGRLKKALRLPDFRDYAVATVQARPVAGGKHAPAGPHAGRRDEG